MRGGTITKLAVLALIGAAVAALVRSLRGEPTPVFSNHPTVTGGPSATRAPSPPTAPPRNLPAKPVAAAPKPESEVAEPIPAPTELAVVDPDAEGEQTWVAPVDGECPDGYPVKAKVKSGIFHLPGSATYERTKPDRCYSSAAAAEADGLRPPKR